MSKLTGKLKTVFEDYCDKTAVTESFSGRSITYRELDILSGKIAARLKADGIGKNDIVPILLPRSFEYIAAEIGAIKAGCAYAPLLDEYPAERIEYICSDCGAKLVIDEKYLSLSAELDPLTEYGDNAENDKALLIYTSGSTGNPKGVIHTHNSFYEGVRRNILNNGMSKSDRTLGIINFSFALSVDEVYDTIFSGAELFMLDNEERKDIRFVKSAIIDNHVTALYINPNMLKRLDLHGSSLRVAQTVGERLSDFYSDEYKIINVYGASETLCALAFELDKAYDNTPVGKAVDSFRAYIIDENGNEAAPGAEGEICVAGALSDGYLNLDEQTAAAFSKNPFSDDEGFRTIYHTNDIGKMLPDGNIIYVNRKDWMVKVNGQRVETGEIEVRIAADVEAVETAVVKAFENEYGMTYLAAYYQVRKGMSVTSEEIEAVLRKKLPDYMIPRFFTEMDKIPLNANGKVDRKSILPPQAASFKEEYAAPENETEKILCTAFEKILCCGQVGINDDFFALGGDSLLAMNLQLDCGLPGLSTEMIFAGKTPRRIAEKLLSSAPAAAFAAEKLSEYPLNPFERGMYIEQKLTPGSTMYNLIGFYEVSGASAESIRAALEEIFRSHEAFHSVYREKDGTILRVLVDEIPDITIEKTDDIREGYEAAKALSKPYDLSAGIPARAVIYTDGQSCLVALLYHHIMFDGGSDGIFARELLSRLSGGTLITDNYDLSAASQEDKEAAYDQGFEKYREMYSDGVPVTELPLKKSRPMYHPHSDTNRQFIIDGDSLQNLRQAAKEKKTTVFNILLASLAATTAKYTASEDVVIGVPVNERDSLTQNTIGMFVNTAPLRIRPVHDRSADEYLMEVSDTVSSFIKENHCPYDRLVAELVKERSDSRNPLFDVGINYIPMRKEYENGGISIRTSYILQSSGKDINFVMQAEESRITCYAQYSSELFDDDIISNFIEQFIFTAENLCSGAGTVQEAAKLPLKQKKALESFSTSSLAYVPVKLLHKMFEAAADKYPEKTSLIACDRSLTLAELESEANRTANALISRGFKKGECAVIMLSRTSRFFAALFGVLKAGGAFIPTDPAYPAERIHSVLDDSEARFVITDEPNEEYDNCVTIDELLSCADDTRPEIEVSPDDLAYMIYTSGSTGKPKGVMLRHIGICSYLTPNKANLHMQYLYDHISTYLSITTVAFDMSFKEHCATLCNGKTLVFASDEEMNNPKLLAELMDKYKVDCINATPSRLQQYLFVEAFRRSIANCKCVISGGEGYPLALLKNLKEYAPDACIFNTYGPTEITVSSNVADLTHAEQISVGRPLLNYIEYIVDKNGSLAPFGVTGELYIGGIGVAKGYKNLPDKTADSFVDYRGQRIFRSGDFAKWDKDGNVLILGRMDNQVKLRGLRIELGEIESVIESYDGIKEVAVAIKTIAGTEHIAAYYTADSETDPNAVREYAASKLTHYMVPTAYLQLKEMPYTLNGKKDMKNLPEPQLLKNSAPDSSSRKLTKFEKELCGIAGKAIGSEVTDVSSSLVSLGLTSLTAIAFTTFVEEKYGCDIPVGKIMHGMSIIEAEDLIYDHLMQGGAGKAEADLQADIQETYPLSNNQLGVYYEVMKKPEELMYNMPLCYCFESVDAYRLKAALLKALAAHSYMNTHIEIRSGNLVQVRNDNADPVIPITEMTYEELEKRKNEFVRPFNLHSDLLYRFEIIKSDSRTYLLSDIHHIIFDGLSRGVFMDAVSKAYAGEEPGKEKLSYFEYALNENKEKDSESYRESEKYFSDMLSKFESVSEIPADKKGRSEDGRIGVVEVPMERDTMEQFCRKNSVTPSSLFLAATFYTVSRFTNSRNVYISTISGGRNDSKVRRTIGMFVHTLPLHMSFEKDITAGELIESSNQAMLLDVEHENYPFMQLADKFGYSTEIMYECQLGVGGAKRTVGDAEYSTEFMKLETPKFKVTIAIEDRADGIAVSIRYNDAVYTREYMLTLADSIKNAAQRMITDASASVREISLLSDSEQQEMESISCTACEEPASELLHKLFEKSAAENPDNTALIACDASLTYTQLNQNANRIAHMLINAGVKPRDSVVLLLPRRSYYFASLFGVLKAGAAFIPCDPEYPADRIRHIIGDSDAAFIITTEDHMSDYPAEKALLIDDLLLGNETDNPDVEISGSDLAYMIYTSGSTGKPKGVMLTHKGICSFCTTHSANILYQLVEKEINTMLAVTTVSFDLSLKDTVGILCSGRTVVFASETEMNDPRALTLLIESNNADAMNATPSRYLQYMEYEPFRKALSRCKLVMAGGEAFPAALMEQLKELGIPNIINTYGPTETTISSNMAFLQNADHVSVGRPLLNYHEYIVDIDGNPVPKGVTGELLIGGYGVARGYKNLDEQTAARFIDYRGERVYKSGDYAKWDSDGNVIILGRMDNQVKLRGLRIELGEIEGLIDKQPHIKKAVVVIKKLAGVENLCAYYTADCEIKPEELKQELAKSLTHYMVPTAYLQLDTMPVTPNGKTDLKALPDPVAVTSGEYSAPKNETEEYFCGLFKKVLKLEKVGATDSFFEIGGTSLLVTSVVIEAAENGYEITYGDIFRKTTPQELAEMFTSEDADEGVRIVDFDNYDYSKINEMLTHNNIKTLCEGEQRPIGNIMLTGATGFMGAHVLAHYLSSETGRAYCLIRKGKFDSPKERLKNIFFYYFDSELENEFDSRVTVLDGDVTNYDQFVPFETLPIDTVFNCAANVKHFSNGTDIEDVNVGGAQNCVKLCKKIGARLIHFSTTSVCGASVDNQPPAGTVLDEQSLYIGQRLDTKYTNSKLLSERVVLEAVADNKLDAKVIRVGTLSAREKDGEFQINFLTNNFMGRLRSFEIIGCFPYSMINSPVCLSPIDESAKAFFALAKTPKECCLFNCTNNHSVPLADIITQMQRSGMNVKLTDDNVFAEALSAAEKDPQKAAILSSMLAYKNMAHGKMLVPILPVNNYTTQALAKMGFLWKPSSEKYMLDFIAALSSLDFFDNTNLSR